MLKLETVFGAGTTVTPDFAAKLAQQASQFNSRVFLECGSTLLSVESLIGILAMDVRKGTRVVVSADGSDEAEAAERICSMLSTGV